MKKISVKGVARAATTTDSRLRKEAAKNGIPLVSAATSDSFINFAHKLGIGADNPLSTASYGYNPITRNRNLLEWIHRGSWLGGVAIDIVADDMTRKGVSMSTEMEPEDAEQLEAANRTQGIWDKLNEAIKWGRLYGGCIAVLLVEGQDPKTPLRLETVGPGQFKGIAVLDRWMLEPSLEDLVTELGPHLGLPKFYKVQANAPALRGATIHHSRVALRHVGIELPYQQALTENLWGVSVLERLYDRMVGFDSASTGMAQLVYKSYLRTMKIKDLRTIVAAGGKTLDGLTAYMDIVRRYQGIEGMTLIDGEDEFEVQQTSAFSGVAGVVDKLAEQVSGALQVPLTRLLGQAPGGLNSDGKSHLATYYDSIGQKQNKLMRGGVETIYKLQAQSEGIKLPDNFSLEFASLWELDDKEKSEVADKVGTAIDRAFDKGLIGRQTSLRELRQASRITGIFSNITSEMIDGADDEVLPPGAELAMGQEHEEDLADADRQHQEKLLDKTHKHSLKVTETNNKSKEKLASKKLPGDSNGKSGQKRKAGSLGGGQKRRALL